jgi:hypothetical protein
MLTAYFIINILLFILSSVSNVIYLANADTVSKYGAAIGLALFVCMICWSVVLLVTQ